MGGRRACPLSRVNRAGEKFDEAASRRLLPDRRRTSGTRTGSRLHALLDAGACQVAETNGRACLCADRSCKRPRAPGADAPLAGNRGQLVGGAGHKPAYPARDSDAVQWDPEPDPHALAYPDAPAKTGFQGRDS